MPVIPSHYTLLYLTKFGLCSLLCLLPLGRMAAHLILDTPQPYQLFSDSIICTAWVSADAFNYIKIINLMPLPAQMFSAILLVLEFDRGLAECWILRSWWVLAYILAAAKLQTVVVFMEQVMSNSED